MGLKAPGHNGISSSLPTGNFVTNWVYQSPN